MSFSVPSLHVRIRPHDRTGHYMRAPPDASHLPHRTSKTPFSSSTFRVLPSLTAQQKLGFNPTRRHFCHVISDSPPLPRSARRSKTQTGQFMGHILVPPLTPDVRKLGYGLVKQRTALRVHAPGFRQRESIRPRHRI